MSKVGSEAIILTAEERDRMHSLYRKGGRERQRAPHIVYPVASCPHDHCDQPMQAIDFRLEDHGRVVHDPLVRAWWDDTGFAGLVPGATAGFISPSGARGPSRRRKRPGIPNYRTTGTPRRRSFEPRRVPIARLKSPKTPAGAVGQCPPGVTHPKCFLSIARLLGTPVSASSFPSNSSEIQPR